MNTKNTLKIYEKKSGYQFFFIRKELQPLFDNLGVFTLICSDGTHYSNLNVTKSGKVQRYFIFASEFFNEHPRLQKHAEIPFSVDNAKGIVRIVLS
jgi:hypothetical protein